MASPRRDREMARKRALAAKEQWRRLLGDAVGPRHVLAGDGGVTVDIAGTMLTIGRVSASGRPVIALNPTRRPLTMGQAIEVLPMGEEAPTTWRVPPTTGDVFWVAGGGVSGTVFGAPTFPDGDAHLIAGGGNYPSPTGTPYSFWCSGTPYNPALFRADTGWFYTAPDGQATIYTFDSETGTEPEPDFLTPLPIVTVRSAPLSNPFSLTPDGAGLMPTVNNTAAVYEYARDPPVGGHENSYWIYDYDEIRLYIMEWPNIRYVRLRHTIGVTWIIDLLDPFQQNVIPDEAWALGAIGSGHLQFARYNPATGNIHIGVGSGAPSGSVSKHILVAWPVADLTPFTPVDSDIVAADVAFAADGTAYFAGRGDFNLGLGWQALMADGTVVAGDGSGSGVFPPDGAAATGGDLGTITGIAVDLQGRLLLGCVSQVDFTGRLAAVTFPAGTIRTIANFGREFTEWPALVEPIASAHFTGFAGLSVDAGGRIYAGGSQIKRIGV